MASLDDTAERLRISNTQKQIRILGSCGTKRNSSTTSRIRRRRFPAQSWCLWVSKTKRMRRIYGLISSSLMPTAKRSKAFGEPGQQVGAVFSLFQRLGPIDLERSLSMA